jgi:hypothetical protein
MRALADKGGMAPPAGTDKRLSEPDRNVTI